MKESAIESSVVRYCSRLGIKFVKLDPTFAKGIPDRMVLLPCGKPLFIEFKTPTGRLSPHQVYWKEVLEGLGYYHEVVDCPAAGKELIDGYITRLPESGS